MTYPQLAAIVVGLAAVVAVIGALAVPASRRRGHLLAVLATASGLAVLTVVFDSLMIHFGLFSFEDSALSGVFLWLAPIEDLSYPLACALALPAVWVLMRRRRDDD